MQRNATLHDSEVRDEVGPPGIQPEGAQQEAATDASRDLLEVRDAADALEAAKKEAQASYTIIRYVGALLPETYRPMIFSKWLRSLRYGNDYFTLIAADAYYHSYHTYIRNLLSQLKTEVRLAVLSDDPDVVLGFSVSRGTTLDYVHVHKDQRRLGIGTKLLPKEIMTITHVTKTGLTIWGSKYPKWAFNPFA